ncbi:YebC/PmpR family DNA-binding transcriptional regulator [Methylophilaceae bacterium]|jgi:YebC/PmpR family DNA-binding regulatory protein|nr:YebC/PmpR family DNA-binding transcriptional regulator [Methylophilaceae bacterium]|tara:strand:+ start:1243 stop:1971 length:729 start_codon:yes stop_codon:yes gene_type:complete
MAGHSKWANIQHRKGRQDAKRGKIFTKLVKEITVAARLGGGDVNFNPRLRTAVSAAKEESMPAENITRAIKRGTGELEGVNYEEIRYEGYGVNGAAIIIDCLTDNKQRAVADVRLALSKNGGNLGTDGCVSYLFKHCGNIFFAPGINSDELAEIAIELGAEDIINNDDGSVEIITPPNEFLNIKEGFDKADLKYEFAELTMKAETENELRGSEGEKMRKILDFLEDLDDVQEVYTNVVIEDN